MKWKNVPECFLPELLRGKPINRLVKDKVEFCYENFIDEGKDAASTSYNILDESRISILAFMGLAIFILVFLIIVVTITLCLRQRGNYNSREETKEGKGTFNLVDQLKKWLIAVRSKEKSIEESLITNNEVSFKIPLQDRVNVFIKDSPSWHQSSSTELLKP